MLPRDPGRDDLVTDDADSPRVLVVDDARDMRAVIRRVLESGGYRVDAVGTLAEARAMAPGEYDAVLVDMHLGSEAGITLIEELAAADPGGASRCLLMSGSLAHAPSGVAALAKPFRPDQLLDAVRALGRAEPASAGRTGPAAGLGAPPAPPAPLAATGRQSAASAGSALTSFGLLDSLRARERAAVADVLHDGPVQDLACALLGLHLIREQLPGAQTELLDSVAGQVSQAATALRGLIGRFSPCWLGEPTAEIIRNQTGWLLAAPPEVDIGPPAEGMSQSKAQLAADVAELALFLASGSSGSESQPPNARIRVLQTEPTLTIETNLSWAAGDPLDDDGGSGAEAWRESLRGEMESALGADIDFARSPGGFQVRVSLRAGRPPAE
jgi:DNA-binding response OmpR family regulator